MERREVKSQDNLEKSVGNLQTKMQVKDLQTEINHIRSQTLREVIAEEFEKAAEKLQSATSCEDIAVVLIQVFSEIAQLLKGF